jgi:hypothetical protein
MARPQQGCMSRSWRASSWMMVRKAPHAVETPLGADAESFVYMTPETAESLGPEAVRLLGLTALM